MRNNYWARIRKTRLSLDIEQPWLIKIYPPDAKGYFDYVGTSRTRTFEQAIMTIREKDERDRQAKTKGAGR